MQYKNLRLWNELHKERESKIYLFDSISFKLVEILNFMYFKWNGIRMAWDTVNISV